MVVLIKDELGIPYGTACGKLRKQLLFEYAKRCDEDKCFKCGVRIETVEEFSIEHKLPWLHIDPDLFWDLNNIAFSHLACNKPHNKYGGGGGFNSGISKRKIGPRGMFWCFGHKDFAPEENFARDKNRWKGVTSICKTCNNIKRKAYYQKTGK